MMSPSPALANRSFLYGAGSASDGAAIKSPAAAVAGEIVYATLDGLALRTAEEEQQQQQLNREGDNEELEEEEEVEDIDDDDDDDDVKPKPMITQKPTINVITTIENGHQNDISGGRSPVEINVTTIISRSILTGPASLPDSIYEYSRVTNLDKSNKKPTKDKQKPDGGEKKREFTFAKNVLHYVPMTSRRYYRKSRKLASKSLSLKSLQSTLDTKKQSDPRTLKCRSLSREELKYVTISLPSNFVHVASATRSSLMTEDPELRTRSLVHITHEGKYADLRGTDGSEYADVGVVVRRPEEKKPDEEVHSKPEEDDAKDPVANDSFLWRRLSRPKDEERPTSNGDEDDDYDDVGPPVAQTTAAPEVAAAAEDVGAVRSSGDEGEDEYDDVGPAPDAASRQSLDEHPEELLYDDVMPPPPPTPPPERKKSSDQDAGKSRLSVALELREALVVEEAADQDEDVYDDVGLPLRANADKERHERVNSLYASSSFCATAADKESEWEDLDDGIYGNCETTKPTSSGEQHQPPSSSLGSPSRKKPTAVQVGPRWSRNKVRRQRSRASRKSSGRSTSRPRSRPASVGTGDGHLQPTTSSAGARTNDAKGASIEFDSSDDSNYETLETYEPDDFSTDSEPEEASTAEKKPSPGATRPHHLPGLIALDEAPYRAVPAPPREASLGHSLGRRMKMLRRTWSITKGSLGRMRRRASGECDTNHHHHQQQQQQSSPGCDQQTSSPTASGADLARKYFSFKKHFRKSQAGAGLSTFYLDKDREAADARARLDEPIYSNGDWYKEVGLYSEHSPYAKNNSQDTRPVDHYSVLAEEPLYQFYAAAATRVAFESDSDGYEEVEELSPSSATTDLARPGHRTLWCQTPQVINSGLLQSLTMEERKIQEAKFEILTSEASYLNSLRVLENEFASNHELVHEVLTPAERERLFGAVPDVLVASERFLAELETIWREDPTLARLPELLLKHGERSAGVYVDYCSNQVSIDVTLKELKAKKGYKFLETVSRIEMHPACHSLSLHSFLMLPMQRITRLPLLADAVLSKLSVEHPERLSWERVLATLSDVVGRCNEGARLAERRNEMDALARKLEYPAKVPPVSLRDKELIRSGPVVQLSTKSDNEYKLTFGKKFQKTPLMLMLLTDYLLVTKLKSNSNEETYSVMDTCKRSLVALESAPEESPFAGRHAMVLTLLENHAGRQVEYVLTCENDTEKERWLDAVSPPKPSCVGETLYESWDCPQVMALYSYAPRQPDELALQPGDVINVLRKMNDGWLFGEKLLDGEQGWFPGNFTKEVASEHVRARNLRQRHRFLALSGSVLQRKAKQSLSLL